jgi:hypothetical protein
MQPGGVLEGPTAHSAAYSVQQMGAKCEATLHWTASFLYKSGVP